MDRRMERDPGMCSTLSWASENTGGKINFLLSGRTPLCMMTVLPSRGISDPEKRMGERDGQDEADGWLCVR